MYRIFACNHPDPEHVSFYIPVYICKLSLFTNIKMFSYDRVCNSLCSCKDIALFNIYEWKTLKRNKRAFN